MNNRLKYLRKDILKLSQKEFGEKISLTLSAISDIERTKRNLNARNIKLICQTFNVNEDWLRQGKEPIFVQSETSLLDRLKIEYNLDGDKFEIVKNYLNFNETERATLIKYLKKLLAATEKERIDELKEYREIKKFDIPVSAGLGNFMFDDIPYDLIEVDLRTYPPARRADFALTISGDSMEPNYYDGDIVFVKEKNIIENGQIGIFIYDGESYIKKYVTENGNAYLVSLNDKYKPIKIEENSTFKILGVVL